MKNVILLSLALIAHASCATYSLTPLGEIPRSEDTLWSGVAILQGHTTPFSTQISLLLPKSKRFSFSLKEIQSDRKIPAQQSQWRGRENSEWGVQHLYYETLRPGEHYQLRVMDSKGTIVDERDLSTLDTRKSLARWVVASCMDDFFRELQIDMWREVQAHRPQMLFLIGDNVYADTRGGQKISPEEVTPSLIWTRYVETWLSLELFRMKRLIPSVAIWDDHDFGVNNGDRNFRYRAESLAIFESFYPQAALGGALEKGPGISLAFRAWGQQFLLLDNRSFRSAKGESPQTHFGAEQTQWILKKIRAFSGPTILMAGNQWFGGYHSFESFEGNHPLDFAAFLSELKATGRKVFFISGDRHLTELMRVTKEALGYETYELTSSGIHAKIYPSTWRENPNPRQIEGVASVQNYAVIESEPTQKNGGIKLGISSWGANLKELYRERVTIE
jgi:hypothetical protein